MSKHISFLTLAVFIIFTENLNAISPSVIYKKIDSSVYKIFVFKAEKNPKNESEPTFNLISTASAVAISNNLLLTNCHAITEENDGIIIENEGKKFVAVPVDGDIKKDICVLYARANLIPASIRLSDSIEIGETVFAIGSPDSHKKLFTNGMVAGVESDPQKGKLIKFTAYINHGSSGGGLFDVNGNLIGITTGTLDNVAYAVSLDWIKNSLPYIPNAQENKVVANQPESSLKEETTSEHMEIQLIALYGKNNISLYKTDIGCLIKIPGRISEGRTVSAAFWFPNVPKAVFFAPYSENINNIMNKLRKIRFSDSNNMTYKQAKDFTFISDKKVPLIYGQLKNDPGSKIHFLALNALPINEFLEGDYFITHFISKNGLFYLPVYFGLYGFGEAYENYKRYCN